MVVHEIEARELGERYPIVEDGVGLTAEDLDGMPEVDEGLREVTGVDALASDVRFSSVGEVGQTQRRVRIEDGRHKGTTLPAGHFQQAAGKVLVAETGLPLVGVAVTVIFTLCVPCGTCTLMLSRPQEPKAP